jgi:hypothetical protein
MARRIIDPDFRLWEAFLNPAPHEDGHAVQIVFRCVSNPGLTSRAAPPTTMDDAEEALRSGAAETLLELLRKAQPLS